MDGILSMNIWMILLLMVSRMHLSYDPLSSGPAANVPQLNQTAEAVEGSTLAYFFVASARAIDNDSTTSVSKAPIRSPLTMDCASTVKDQDISLNFAHSSHVQPVVQSHRQPALHSHNLSLSEKDKYNVEHENYEYEGETLTVKNRLKDHVEFWKNVLSPSELVLSTVEFGYAIPFFQDPPSICLKNNRSSFDNSEFVIKAITELKLNGCIAEVSYKPYVVNPLTVSVNDSGKQRLVLDLRHVNKYVQKQKIKFEGVNEAKQYAKNGNYMVKFDMRSGYHHLNIHSEHQKYLGFSWIIDGKQKYFIFTILPFGLCSAGHIFY